jgi:hypothetical protein
MPQSNVVYRSFQNLVLDLSLLDISQKLRALVTWLGNDTGQVVVVLHAANSSVNMVHSTVFVCACMWRSVKPV